MKREIARSFSRTIQVKQFEPIQVFASYKELEIDENADEQKISEELYQNAKRDVEKSIAEYTAPKSKEKEINVLEAEISVATDELIDLKKFPEENKRKIAERKFGLELCKNLLKQVKGK